MPTKISCMHKCGYSWNGNSSWAPKLYYLGFDYVRGYCGICDIEVDRFLRDKNKSIRYANPLLEHIYESHSKLFLELYIQRYIRKK